MWKPLQKPGRPKGSKNKTPAERRVDRANRLKETKQAQKAKAQAKSQAQSQESHDICIKINGKEFKPEPIQREFMDFTQPWRFRYLQGGFGGMKTVTLCAAIIELGMYFPKGRWLVARKNYTDLEDSTMKTFFMMCPPEIIAAFNKAKHFVTLSNGTEILFEGAEDEEKFRSYELSGFALDEASQLSEKLIYMLVSRIGRIPHIPHQHCYGFLASNPPNTDHWLHKMFVKESDPGIHKMWYVSARDNKPLLEMNPCYVKDLERIYAHDPQLVDVYIDGKFGFAMGGARVYPEFNPNLHTGNFQYNPSKSLYMAWDFGYRHPAMLWGQFDNNDRFIWLHEDMGKDITITPYIDHIDMRSNTLFPEYQQNILYEYCDDAGSHKTDTTEQTSIDILRTKGHMPRHRRYEWLKARDLVGKKLTTLIDGKPSLLINNTCQLMIEGFKGGYRFDEEKEGKAPKESPKQEGYYEHLHDCNLILHANLFTHTQRRSHRQSEALGRSYAVGLPI